MKINENQQKKCENQWETIQKSIEISENQRKSMKIIRNSVEINETYRESIENQ